MAKRNRSRLERSVRFVRRTLTKVFFTIFLIALLGVTFVMSLTLLIVKIAS